MGEVKFVEALKGDGNGGDADVGLAAADRVQNLIDIRVGLHNGALAHLLKQMASDIDAEAHLFAVLQEGLRFPQPGGDGQRLTRCPGGFALRRTRQEDQGQHNSGRADGETNHPCGSKSRLRTRSSPLGDHVRRTVAASKLESVFVARAATSPERAATTTVARQVSVAAVGPPTPNTITTAVNGSR